MVFWLLFPGQQSPHPFFRVPPFMQDAMHLLGYGHFDRVSACQTPHLDGGGHAFNHADLADGLLDGFATSQREAQTAVAG